MKGKLLSIIGLSIIGIAVLFIVIAFYWAFMPVKVLAPQIQPYKVLTPSVAPGDTFLYQVNVCKFREATGVVTRSFIDENGTGYPLPPTQGSVKKGCQKANIPVIVPLLHPGKWYITLDVGYKVNPLRTEYYHLTTDKFVILPQEHR